jgi:acyl-CoA thioesterase I
MLSLYRMLFVPGVLLLAGCGGAPLNLAAQPKPLVYVALGASDAVGVGTADPTREGWVPALHRRLPAETRLVNLGISGSLLRDALVQQLPVALDAEPDLVTVWLAVNDFNARVPLEEYTTCLDALLTQLAAQTRAKTLVANIPDLTRVPLYDAIPRAVLSAEIARWNAAIAATTQRHGAVLVDLYPLGPELASRPDYVATDGFHPSVEGYRRLAEVMWTTIESQGVLP